MHAVCQSQRSLKPRHIFKYVFIPITEHEDGVIMHVLYVRMKVNVKRASFFQCILYFEEFFVVEVVSVCTEGNIMWTGKMAGSSSIP